MTAPTDPGHDPPSTRAIVLTVPGLWNLNPDQGFRPSTPRSEPSESPAVLVAHSLGYAAVAHWAELGHLVRGALLVAPADVEVPGFPEGARGLAPMPLRRLAFRSIVVASTNERHERVGLGRVLRLARGRR